jgi:hypothetical protein
MPWLRLWIDILDNVELNELPESTCWAWALMLTVAKKIDQDGTLPEPKKLAYLMHKPQAKVEGWISELVEAGLLERYGVTTRLHGWLRWQEPKDKSAAERMRRYRKRKKTPLNSPIPDTDTDTDTDSEGVTHIRLQQLQELRRNAESKSIPDRQRQTDDEAQFQEGIRLLGASLQTESVSLELSRNSDLPGVLAIEGWRWLFAARQMTAGIGKKTFAYLRGMALGAKIDDFREQEHKPKPTNGKPSPIDPGKLAARKREMQEAMKAHEQTSK